MTDEGSTAATWVSDAWRSTRDELVLFLRTVRDFVRGPRALMRAWVAGHARPMNPLGYFGMCLLLVAPEELLLSWRSQARLDEATRQLHVTSHMMDVLRAVGPYAGLLVTACLGHAFLRLFGAKGSLSRTLGALLYAEGADVVTRWVLLPYRYFYAHVGGPNDPRSATDIAVFGVNVVVWGYFGVLALSGAHGVQRWRVVVALVLMFAGLGALASGAVVAWTFAHGGFHPPAG